MIPKSLYRLFCSSHNPFFLANRTKKSPVDPYYPSILKYSNVQALLMSFLCFYCFITGCNETNMYGRNCDILCPTNCKNNTCHIQQGICFGCQPGWTGLYCNISKIRIFYFSYLQLYIIIFHCM